MDWGRISIQFLTRKNNSVGPIGKDVNISSIRIGDIVQLSFDNNIFTHSLIVTDIMNSNIFVSTHTEDVLNQNLGLYNFKKVRFIHIEKLIY